jgi:CheY-like chemotaxis protein
MDIYMPVMDGIEAAAKINEICADIPIVAITAKVFSNDLEIYEKSGMKDCINKPFTSQELWRCMTKYFDPIDNKNINTDVNDSDDEKSIEELEFLKKLKISFLRNCKNKYMEIIDALEKNDIKLAHRLAHGFKSNAGQIGKIHLQHAAMYIERHLKDGKNLVTPMQMTLFEKELNNTILQLHEELSPDTTQQEDNFYISNDITEFGDISEFNDTSKSKKSFGSSDSLDSKENINSDDDLSGNSSSLILLNKLELLLKTGNPECLKLANNIQNITCDEERKKKLIQQMDDFEFEEALFTLSEIKKMM